MQLNRPRLEEGWSTLFLVWALVYSSALVIPKTELTNGLQIIPPIATLAVLSGLLLAKSQFNSRTAQLFGLVFGLFAVFYLVGTISDFAGMPWYDRLLHPVNGIITRQWVWMEALVTGGTSRDGLMFVTQTALVYWVLGTTAAWYTFRAPRVWRVVVPAGLVLLSVVYYYNGPKPLQYYLAVYLILAMLFVARTYLVAQEKEWRSSFVRYEKQIWYAFIRAGFIASLLALIFAWGLPPLSASATVSDALGGAKGPWREFQDGWTRMFSALRTYSANTADPYQDTLVLGGPRNPGNVPVMDVFVAEKLPYVYWQAIVYDTYTENGAWLYADDPYEELYPEDGPINTPPTQARELITQTVVSYFPNSSFVYGAPEIVSVDRPVNVFASADENGNKLVSAVRSKFVIQQGDQYQVVSRISFADAASLRHDSTQYPAWVTDKYLQMPDSITPETIALAEELTAEFTNPFDKAIAIRDYLRENIAYNDQIQAAPPGVEPIHYTLFVRPEGYCNYYASAMAIMLRSQGIPARIVSGYAQGVYDEETRSYRVRASNAHTWVELYFPTYGWIQFEPTASIPIVPRPENTGGGDAFAAEANAQLEQTPLLDELDPNNVIRDDGVLDATDLERGPGAETATAPAGRLSFPVWPAITAALILAAAITLSLLASHANRRVEADVEKGYGRLNRWSRWLGIHYRPVDTPYERAETLAAAVPEGKEPIHTLTRQYVLKQYSPQKSCEDSFDPLPLWRQLRPLLLRRTLTVRFNKWRQ